MNTNTVMLIQGVCMIALTFVRYMQYKKQKREDEYLRNIMRTTEEMTQNWVDDLNRDVFKKDENK